MDAAQQGDQADSNNQKTHLEQMRDSHNKWKASDLVSELRGASKVVMQKALANEERLLKSMQLDATDPDDETLDDVELKQELEMLIECQQAKVAAIRTLIQHTAGD